MSKSVKLVKARMFELDPEKVYISIFEQGTIDREDVQAVNNAIKDMGIKGLSIVLKGNPKHIRIIEAPPEKEADEAPAS